MYNKEKNREYQAKWYKKNKQLQQTKVKLNRLRLLNYTDEIKKNTPCSHCGFSDYRALQFHHKSPKKKSFNIAKGRQLGLSIANIAKEIEKCIVLCANCHSIEHSAKLPPD